MTNEKMLEKMYECKKRYEDSYFDDIIKELTEDIRAECQKSKGNAKRDKLIKNMLKKVEETRPVFKECYQPSEDGKFGFTDGSRLYVLNDDFGYPNGAEKYKNALNLEQVRPDKRYYDEPVIIDIPELKTYIKEQKAIKKATRASILKPYEIKYGKGCRIGFNPEYLLEFCQMFETDTIYCKPYNINPEKENQCSVSPAYYENNEGEWGELLPIRLKKE